MKQGIRTVRMICAAAASVALSFSAASAGEMRVSSFEPAPGFFSKTLQAWIDEVNPKLSAENQFKLYPGGILGSPPAQAELVAKGVADVAFVVTTYTVDLFPMTSVVEVPGVVSNATSGSAILNTLLDEGMLGDEYANYKVVALFSTPGYRMFVSGDAVRTPDDMKGLRMRSPSAFGSQLFETLGASGVPIPAPQVYENIERNVVGGAAWTMDAYKTFRLSEVAPTVTNTRFIATPLAFLMNKATYEGLPDADRAVIDEMSLASRSAWVADRIDTVEAKIEADLRSGGEVQVIDLTEAEAQAWTTALSVAGDLWVDSKPENAAAVLKRASELGE